MIPEKVVGYNVYNGGGKLTGVTGEVTLPNLEAMSETISGAGIAGEYESPTPGHFGSTQIEIPFRTLYDTSFNLMVPKGQTLVLRASQQSYDVSDGQVKYRPLKITLRTIPKGIDLGKIGTGKPTETKNTLEVLYIKIEENGKVLLELDKLNFIFIVNGIDVLGPIRSQI
ncbi:MAG: phage major tail tube protein [Vallitalea sp.]|jgi:P2 family phage contractile tail tube protein|nr:phage major tail tube protein [Vallitalea sp.]